MSNLKYTDDTPIKDGDCFFVIVGNDQFKDNIYHTPLLKLELNASSRKITTNKIKLFYYNNKNSKHISFYTKGTNI